MVTLWGGAIPSGTSSTATGARTDGLTFTVTQPGWQLSGVGWYVPSAETDLNGADYSGLLWTTTSGTAPDALLGSAAGSGTWTTGAWNFIALPDPIELFTNMTYVAGIGSPNLIQFVHNFWGFGGPGVPGMTSVPIFAPGMTSAPGDIQQGNVSGAGVFPNTSSGSWYGVDILLTPVATPSTGGYSLPLLMAGLNA